MIGSIDPLGQRMALARAERSGGRSGRTSAGGVHRAEKATVVQLSEYALGRRQEGDREPSKPPSWAQAVVQMVFDAAVATRAAILGSPALAEVAQAQLSAGRVATLTG